MNTTTLTITADQRAPIHRQAIQRLSGIGDVNLAIERGDYASAERLADEYAEDLALLADLGWAPGDSRDSFELTMRAGELMQTLQRLRGDAEAGLGEPEARRAAEEAAKVRAAYERTAEVCSELIATLDRDPGRGE